MSSSVTVCPNCRTTCAICHASTKGRAHPFWACNGCKHKTSSKCYVCGGSKNGSGSGGATGTGTVCDRCFKPNTCSICQEHN